MTTSPDVDLLLVTGMSGAGRSTVAKALEDQRWYVIDNLPPQLLDEVVGLAMERPNVRRMAVVVDARSSRFDAEPWTAISAARKANPRLKVIFVDATDEALVRRFESVRRPHPLQNQGRLLDGIQTEREILREVRSQADVVIDTSGLSQRQLKAKTDELFGYEGDPTMRVAVMSFGFKYGIPLDADIVLDLRFLPNPFWIPELRHDTGQDEGVRDFVLGVPGAAEFLDNAVTLLNGMTKGFLREGRTYLTVAVGCTGGKHRSVAVAEELAARIAAPDVGPFIVHRDLGRE